MLQKRGTKRSPTGPRAWRSRGPWREHVWWAGKHKPGLSGWRLMRLCAWQKSGEILPGRTSVLHGTLFLKHHWFQISPSKEKQWIEAELQELRQERGWLAQRVHDDDSMAGGILSLVATKEVGGGGWASSEKNVFNLGPVAETTSCAVKFHPILPSCPGHTTKLHLSASFSWLWQSSGQCECLVGHFSENRGRKAWHYFTNKLLQRHSASFVLDIGGETMHEMCKTRS